ncbi:type I polyketide synthase, partial [Micromonospora sp. NPDC048898]|uniref:type I polyketide synthase n=1 Tax=Micromonospora sp. NPDC048898 TaxID=3364260 RepID=UPI003720D2F3
RILLIDTDTPTPPEHPPTNHPQTATRNTTTYRPRVVHAAPPELVPPPGPWCLDVTDPGTLDAVRPVPAPGSTRPLAAGEVRVAVRAAGLNFRDVLMALGMYPGELVLGSEGAGVVTEVAAGVTGLAPGDRVMGLLPHSFGPLAIADHRLLTRIPAGWTFAEAAGTPIVFLTAYYGLRDLGRLTAGESVLIHAAAGGVGMAAVQLARHFGAEVFGTASEGKWPVLRAQGLSDDRIASSRDLGFATAFRAATGGRGIDVVLNSLADEFVDASIDVLADGGRLVEMGKTDVRDPAAVAAARPGAGYQAFDLMDAGPDRIREMLTELVALFEAGTLTRLPVQARDIREAPEAFRYMSQARHVGKLVLTLPVPPDPDGTVLVTGGTGLLGAHVARHLVTEHGLRHLVLTSRRGPAAPGAADLARELTELGASVTVTACDVADRADLARVLAAVPAGRPLTGVVHAAGVSADATVASLTAEATARVFAPKVDAAAHLDALTRGDDLSFFVLFSSIAGVVGTAGQGNYAAANTWLDALAARRRGEGLAAVSLSWGFWAEESELSGHLGEADRVRLARTGILPLPTPDGLALLDEAFGAPGAHLVPARLDLGAPDLPPILRDEAARPVRRTAATATTAGPGIGALPEAERDTALHTLVRSHTASVLGHASAESFAAGDTFRDLGFDSLAAVELRNRLSSATGLTLPAGVVFDYPTPEALAGFLSSRFAPASPGGTAVSDLDQLEAALAAGTVGGDDRRRLVHRLQTLLWRLEGGTTGSEPTGELGQASDDEMFALLDQELGR